MRRSGIASAIGMLALVTACTTPPTTGPPAASSNTTTAPSPTPKPTPTVAVDELKTWVEAARLTPAEVGATTPARDQSGVLAPLGVCGQTLASDADVTYAHASIWAGTRLSYVEHAVYGYQTGTGAAAVDQEKQRVAACHSYTLGDTASADGSAQMSVTGDYALSTPSGVDTSYAFCELSDTLAPASHKGEKASICTAYLARGHILVTVRVFGDHSASMGSAQMALNQAVAVAATQLVAAVPAT